MKKVLVTGGCGFIGSNFIRLFLKSHPDHQITNLDKLTYCGNPENLADLEHQSRYEFIRGDICDASAVEKAMRGAEGLIHFAAETHVDRSIDNSDDFIMTNVFGTRMLLEIAKEQSLARFVHISTDEVYGSIERGAAAEDAPLAPNSPYSAAKAASDLLVRSYWKTYGLPAVIIRSSNNYGPYQFPEKVIPLFVTNLLEGKKVPLYGDGQNRREWIHVEDHCRAITLVYEKGVAGDIYNIGTGFELSNIDLTRRILQAMNKGEESIQYVTDRLGHDFRYSINVDKIHKLGFQPLFQFDDGLNATIEWYRRHPHWWKPLKKDKFTVK